MTTFQKVLAVLSFLCYALVLFGFLTSSQYLMLIAFVLHSVFLIWSTILMARMKLPELPTSDASESVEMIKMLQSDLAKKSKEIDELTSANHKLTKQLNNDGAPSAEQAEALKAAKKEAEELTEQLSQARLRIDELVAENENQAVARATASDYETLLPPIEEGSEATETIDIIAIAKETVHELMPFAKEADIQIQISAPEQTLFVKANASRLRIMFRNIIDNSIKYMARAGILVVTISNVGDDIFIVLKDNGKGLASTETEHIFELNFQGSNRISGNGLGLTQAKAIVNYYGGTIYAKSNEDKGMGVYIQLPTL